MRMRRSAMRSRTRGWLGEEPHLPPACWAHRGQPPRSELSRTWIGSVEIMGTARQRRRFLGLIVAVGGLALVWAACGETTMPAGTDGARPALNVHPGQLRFGEVLTGSTVRSSFYISNTGSVLLQIDTLIITGGFETREIPRLFFAIASSPTIVPGGPYQEHSLLEPGTETAQERLVIL